MNKPYPASKKVRNPFDFRSPEPDPHIPSHVVGGSKIGFDGLETALLEAENTADFYQSKLHDREDEVHRLEVLFQSFPVRSTTFAIHKNIAVELQQARFAEREARSESEAAVRKVKVATDTFDAAYDEAAR